MAGRAIGVWKRHATTMKPSEQEKERIVGACEAVIHDVFKPIYLAEIKPTAFNYCVDIQGDWRAGRYRFLQRMRSGFADNRGEEFDRPFARLDYMGGDRFDIQRMDSSGRWWRIYNALTFEEALDSLKNDTMLQPLC